MTQALEGIRILDLTITEPGQFCTMILGDLGAEVIKIEEPQKGCPSRAYGPAIPSAQNMGLGFIALCRNKKSLALNLRTKEGKDIFFQLAKTADVFLEGLRPGATRRLGIDYETLSQINPRLICCSMTGFGQDGPYVNVVGHELNNLAISGLLSVSDQIEGRPVFPPVTMSHIGAMNAIIGILAALMARERTGLGQHVDTAMTEGIIFWLYGRIIRAANRELLGPAPLPPESRELRGDAPWYNVYETKDGKLIALGCLEDKFWESLCRTLGREDFTDRSVAYGEKRRQIFAFLRETFRTKTRHEWFSQMKELDAALTPVNTIEEVLTDPQVLHRQALVESYQPGVGMVKHVANPIRLSRTPPGIKSPAPTLGEHTETILRSLGYTTEQITGLQQAGVIR